jgi:hypothetical protein
VLQVEAPSARHVFYNCVNTYVFRNFAMSNPPFRKHPQKCPRTGKGTHPILFGNNDWVSHAFVHVSRCIRAARSLLGKRSGPPSLDYEITTRANGTPHYENNLGAKPLAIVKAGLLWFLLCEVCRCCWPHMHIPLHVSCWHAKIVWHRHAQNKK